MRSVFWTATLALAVALAAGVTSAPDRQGPTLGKLAQLLSIPAVEQELKLSPSQSQAVRDLRRKIRLRQEKLDEERRTLPRDEWAKRFEAFDLEQETLYAEGVPLAPSQLARLRQLDLQLAGIRVVSRPDVAAELKLTPEQLEQIAALVGAERVAMQKLIKGEFLVPFRASKNPDEQAKQQEQVQEQFRQMHRERERQIQELRSITDARITAVLTPAQRERFTGMQGPRALPTAAIQF